MTGGDVDRALRAANAYLDAGNFGAAIDAARDVLSSDPENIQALDLSARALLRKGDAGAAAEAADRLIEAAPDYDAGYRFKSALLVDKGGKADLKQALELIENACNLDPEQPANRSILAFAQEGMDDFKNAEDTYLAAISEFPWYHDLKTEYATFLVNRGRMDEANTVFADVSEEAPGDIDVIILRGHLALREGRTDEALENALWALNEEATNSEAIRLLAQVKARKNPILGLWWRYAVWINRFSSKQVWGIVIGLYLAWQLLFRGFLKQLPDPIPAVAVIIWLSFCLLTWIAPSILKRMIDKELETVRVRDF